MDKLHVLYEDNHLLIVNKPAGVPTMGGEAGQPSMVTMAADWIRKRYQKPGRVFVGVVSRLDSLVSGVLVLARTSKAAQRLSQQFLERTPGKIYCACVEGRLEPGQKLDLEDWLIKDEARHRMAISKPHAVTAQLAQLELLVIQSAGNRSLIEVRLHTGRKHQIRVQLANRGWPIVGDRKYGAKMMFPDGIALHCRRLTIEHPTRRSPISVEAALPSSWNSLPPSLRFEGT